MNSNGINRPSTATRRWNGQPGTVDLSVSAMANANDAVSMVGAPPCNIQHIDHYALGRAALDFVGVTVEHHETLAEHLGGSTAAEVLLLIIAWKCETGKRKWEEAKDLGIPG